mgnify:CR=1 FL=1
MITKEVFDCYNGQDVFLYTLYGDGIEVGITDFGAAVQFIRLKTKNGIKDICLGYSSIKERLESGTFCGATIGRVANRIRGSEFTLNGKKYDLPNNDGKNCNHGGNGFHTRLFENHIKKDVLVLTLVSPDGDQGFPGKITLRVEYEIVGKALEVRYTAVSDKDTVWSPTCHIYFNLKGEDGGNIKDTVLKINGNKITLLDEEHIPTGETLSVAETPFDFITLKPIGLDIDAGDSQLQMAGGYDHNYILNGEYAATAYSADSGIEMSVFTDMPGLQFYSGNYLKGKGKTCEYLPRDGFCLEPQYFPDAVNHENFPSPILKSNCVKIHYIRYEFNV